MKLYRAGKTCKGVQADRVMTIIIFKNNCASKILNFSVL